ncbi:MAG TPA: efflux RND transporter periplasmic adaptor subunit [Opitutaceae bacterium]|nr:efflux RND transporter periplasmic adaptor subunit [Opitutaceae bacterium]
MKTDLDSAFLEKRITATPRPDAATPKPEDVTTRLDNVAPRPDDTTPRPAATAPVSPNQTRKSGRRWLKWSIAFVLVAVLGYAIVVRPLSRRGAAKLATSSRRGGVMTGPVPVSAQPAQQADLDVRLAALGTVTPFNTITVRSRVDGELQKVYFSEGATVEAGAPLADIDPRPFEAQKAQAEAQLAKDTALLENARVDLNRFKTLLAQDSVSGQQVDTQAALVRQYEASEKLDQAQVDTAALQLTYAHITAPIGGRIGLRLVDSGNIVHAADATGLAVITQLKPISVIFSVPQANVPRIMQRLNSGQSPVVDAYDRDGKTLLAQGKLVTVDNQIDPTTGTIKLRAEFPNDNGALFPNQFVNVQLLVDQLKGATVITTAAVQQGSVGTYVYVVTPQKTAAVRTIQTGPSDNGLIAVTKGLSPGESVVVDGLDHLRDGSAIELITSGAKPGPSPNHGGAPHSGQNRNASRQHDNT